MDTTFEKLKKYFLALPQNTITKIYHARCARLKLLMNHEIPEDVRWLIEARSDYQVSPPILSFHTYLKQEKHFCKEMSCKQLKVCHRYAKLTCNATCRSLGMVSINHEDKIQFIKDGLSKGSLDDLLLTLETHPSGDMHHAIYDLWPQFHKEHARHSLENLTKKDHVCQFLKKLDGKPIPDP